MTTAHLPAKYRRAAEIIKTNGFLRGAIYDFGQLGMPGDARRVDVNGALGIATTGHPVAESHEVGDAETFLVSALGLGGQEPPLAVLRRWNDNQPVDEVLAALEQAAVAAESGGAE